MTNIEYFDGILVVTHDSPYEAHLTETQLAAYIRWWLNLYIQAE